MMPNLSPVMVRKNYDLYDNKLCTGEEAAESKKTQSERMKAIGYYLDFCRGDYKEDEIRTGKEHEWILNMQKRHLSGI